MSFDDTYFPPSFLASYVMWYVRRSALSLLRVLCQSLSGRLSAAVSKTLPEGTSTSHTCWLSSLPYHYFSTPQLPGQVTFAAGQPTLGENVEQWLTIACQLPSRRSHCFRKKTSQTHRGERGPSEAFSTEVKLRGKKCPWRDYCDKDVALCLSSSSHIIIIMVYIDPSIFL